MFIDLQRVPRHELVDSLIEGLFAGDVPEREIFSQDRLVEFRPNTRVGENRFDFRTEKEPAAVPLVIEGFNTESIAGSEQTPLRSIPNHECKHAPQMLHAGRVIFLVEMNDSLRVAVRAVPVAF